jgi:hypothetical protein
MASTEPIPAVVETAALDLFYRYPRLVYSAEEAEKLVPLVKKLSGPLRAERAFAGLCWPDAHRLVGAMVSAVCNGEPAESLNGLARRAREGLEDVRDWVDDNAVARSLDIIANLMQALRK